jgi:hypothetical protein
VLVVVEDDVEDVVVLVEVDEVVDDVDVDVDVVEDVVVVVVLNWFTRLLSSNSRSISFLIISLITCSADLLIFIKLSAVGDPCPSLPDVSRTDPTTSASVLMILASPSSSIEIDANNKSADLSLSRPATGLVYGISGIDTAYPPFLGQ